MKATAVKPVEGVLSESIVAKAAEDTATASTSYCGSGHQDMKSCWTCDQLFPVDQGNIPVHPCASAKTYPVHSPRVRPEPSPPKVLKEPVRMLDGSPVWSKRPK